MAGRTRTMVDNAQQVESCASGLLEAMENLRTGDPFDVFSLTNEVAQWKDELRRHLETVEWDIAHCREFFGL